MKTLSDIGITGPNLVAKLHSVFRGSRRANRRSLQAQLNTYAHTEDFLRRLMDAERHVTLANVLRAKKNIILQGALA